MNLGLNLGKEEMFDNFLADLFSNKLQANALGIDPRSLPLDRSLMVTTAKKQRMEALMNIESGGNVLSNL